MSSESNKQQLKKTGNVKGHINDDGHIWPLLSTPSSLHFHRKSVTRLLISLFYRQGKPNCKDFTKLWKLDRGYIRIQLMGLLLLQGKPIVPSTVYNDI